MVTKMKGYLMLDDKDDDADFRYNYRDTKLAQFKQGLNNKTFNRQDQGKCDENDTLQKRIKHWPNVFDMGLQYLITFRNMVITVEWIFFLRGAMFS